MDWQPGDLALCVRAGRFEDLPQVGSVNTVQAVAADCEGTPTLFLERVQNETFRFFGHRASRFIKVTPEAEDRFDRETIELLNAEPVVPLVSLERGVVQ